MRFGKTRNPTLAISIFHHRLRTVQSITTVHQYFHRRPHMYDRSPRCLLQFSSQTTPDQIGLDSSVLIRCRPNLYDQSHHCLVWFSLQNICNLIVHDISRISHIVVLYNFHHNQHLIRLVTIVQYRFQRKPHLCNRSHRCLVQFLSQCRPSILSSQHMSYQILIRYFIVVPWWPIATHTTYLF